MGSSAGQPSCAPRKGKVREKMLKTTSFWESEERQGKMVEGQQGVEPYALYRAAHPEPQLVLQRSCSCCRGTT